jgi:proteasome lid subunit RPN8/RPN11
MRPAILVPAEIREQIRAHAETVEPGHEICGRLIVRSADLCVTEYRRERNAAVGPGRARPSGSWRRQPGFFSLPLHSHPSASAGPSAGDLRWAAAHRDRSIFAVFTQADSVVHVFRLRGRDDCERLLVLHEIER